MQSGDRIGPYTIGALLGQGGMGQVFRARDARLNRDVAIKVLPASVAADAERRARLVREAQAIAALSHPNILAVYDTGESEGSLYVVTELLEGETLRARLSAAAARGEARGGPMPVRKAIEIATQIARGLAAAHEKGIVHRDIKPENVFLLNDGHVKILDFGLAAPARSASGASTTNLGLTDPGSVMGTVGYMAPEQVRGQPVDGRTDIFALGSVLYEMLAGRRAFQRETAAETMTAILRDDLPDLAVAHPDLAPALERILRHCLEKNPAERFQSARDVAFALEALSGSGTATSRTAAVDQVAPSRRSSKGLFWAAGVVAAAVLGALTARWFAGASGSPQFDIKTFDRQVVFNARFMPDGQTIVYSAARRNTVPELFILHPDSVAPQPIGGPGTHLLSVSSKGELAVLTNAEFHSHHVFTGTLATMSPGGSPRALSDGVREADWSPDGSSLAIVRVLRYGRDRIEYPIGMTLYEADGYLSDVRVSKDGRRVAFAEHAFTGDTRGRVKVIDLAKHVVTLTDELWGIEGIAWQDHDQHVLFSGSTGLRAGGVSYEPFIVPPNGSKPPERAFGVTAPLMIVDASADGRWLALSVETRNTIGVRKPGEAADREIAWLDLSMLPTLSRDGTFLVFGDENPGAGSNYSVMLDRLDGSPPVRLGEGAVTFSAISPDGKRVAARVSSSRTYAFYPVGTGETQVIASVAGLSFFGWFPDSRHVLMCGKTATDPQGCYQVDLVGADRTRVGPAGTTMAGAGPDGWMTFGDAAGHISMISPDGKVTPVPRPPGDFFFFISYGRGGTAFFSTTLASGAQQLGRVSAASPVVTPIGEIAVPDRAGLVDFFPYSVVDVGGKYGYAYQIRRELSKVVVVSWEKR